MNSLAKQFSYLDNLRESGVTNMFGAAPYLSKKFGLDKPEARKILRLWMDTYSADKTPTERAKIAGALP
jgi:hypothetical protein